MPDLPKIDARLDITREICPMTFVKTKLELEELSSGQVLEVILRDGEPLKNVTRSCEEEGNPVLHRAPDPDRPGIWHLLVRRG